MELKRQTNLYCKVMILSILTFLSINCAKSDSSTDMNNLLMALILLNSPSNEGILIRQINRTVTENSSRLGKNLDDSSELNIVGIPLNQYGDGLGDGKYDHFETPERTILEIANIYLYKSPEAGGVPYGTENAFNSNAKLVSMGSEIRPLGGILFEAEEGKNRYLDQISKRFVQEHKMEEFDRIAISISSIRYTFSETSNLGNISDIELEYFSSYIDPEYTNLDIVRDSIDYYEIYRENFTYSQSYNGDGNILYNINLNERTIQHTINNSVFSTPFFHCPVGKFYFDCYNEYNRETSENLIKRFSILNQTGQSARDDFNINSNNPLDYSYSGNFSPNITQSWKKIDRPDTGLKFELGEDSFKKFRYHLYMFVVVPLEKKSDKINNIAIEVDPTNVFVWESDTDNDRRFEPVPVPMFKEGKGVIRIEPEFADATQWKNQADQWRDENPLLNENAPDPINEKEIKVHLPIIKAYYE